MWSTAIDGIADYYQAGSSISELVLSASRRFKTTKPAIWRAVAEELKRRGIEV